MHLAGAMWHPTGDSGRRTGSLRRIKLKPGTPESAAAGGKLRITTLRTLLNSAFRTVGRGLLLPDRSLHLRRCLR